MANAARWLRLWFYGLNGGLLIFAAGLMLTVGGRFAYLTLVLVPATLIPFSYARLRLHRSLAEWLTGSGRVGAVYALTCGGILLDAVMTGQLLTARSTTNLSLLRASGIAWIGPVWFSAHALLFLAYALLGAAHRIGQLGRWSAAKLSTPRQAPEPSPGELVVGRRAFLQQVGLVGAGAPFIVSLSSIQLSYAFRVEERELHLPHWPKALDGLRVAHLSDIHVGGAMNRERLLHVAALTNEARPDLVLHTGDFLTHRVGDFDTPLYEALARVRAPLGQWASLGNHDFDDPNRLVSRLHDAGVETLRDRLVSLTVDGAPLELGGIDFQYSRRRAAAYEEVIGQWRARDGAARLILSHDPSAFFGFPAGCTDLVLSGHMHGGQIGLQLGPMHALTLVGLVGIPDQGVFTNGDLRMYVTRCVGFYGYPMRLGIPPEIALLTLRSA